MILLEAKDISKWYQNGGWFGRKQRVKALSGISLIVEEGHSFGLIGRSGAGKSTLCRVILGLERPDDGAVLYRGKSFRSFCAEDWRQFRREVQVVFQNALGSVNPRWQVEDIISEPLRNMQSLSLSKRRAIVQEQMALVGLCPDDVKKYPHQFSGGQLQRVCIARALSVKPRLVILDEAVSSLDMLTQAQILSLLRELQQTTAVTYLFISHDIRLVAGFCDTVSVMHQGRMTSSAVDPRAVSAAGDSILQQLAHAILPCWPSNTFLK